MHGLVLLTLISITFQWKAGPVDATHPAPTGFRLYTTDVSGNYTGAQVVDVGNPTPDAQGWISYRWSNWDVDNAKFVVVRSYTSIAESGNSPELSVGKPSAPATFTVKP